MYITKERHNTNEVRVVVRDKTNNCRIYDYIAVFELVKTYQEEPNTILLKDVYRYGLKTHGRCVSKIYEDRDESTHIGYVFERKVKHIGSKNPFIKEVWVSIVRYTEEIVRTYDNIK